MVQTMGATRFETGLKNREQTMRRRIILALVILVALFLLFMPGRGGVHLLSLKRKNASLSLENKEIQMHNTALRKEIKHLQTDTPYLEELARKEHGLLKKNEFIYNFEKRSGAGK